MDVSIIIPALNEENYITACIVALKNQETKLKFEIIVVDNNSTDKTTELANCEGVEVISCKKKGIAITRNEGAKHSKGKILIFVDADTLLSPNYLQKSWEYFQEHLDVVGLTGKMVLSGEKEYIKLIGKVDESVFKLLEKLKRGRIIGANAAIRRNIFFEVGGFPEVHSEDVIFSKFLREKGGVAYLPEIEALTSSRRLSTSAC